MEIVARSHRGRVRADNEDCVDFDAALGMAVLAEGMGTTLVAAVSDGDAVWVAHAGDSRAYRFAGRALSRVTVDHSVVQSLVDAGLLTPAQARRAPNRHIVTRALGILEAIECDVGRVPLAAGDLLIFCSDGLTDMLDDATIAGICLGHANLGSLVDALVAARSRQAASTTCRSSPCDIDAAQLEPREPDTI